jgi:hypothetical protein
MVVERQMDVQIGDRVLVNLAPFIGSARRCMDSVPCGVTEVDGTRIRVSTEVPHRLVDLWVPARWVDGRLLEPSQRLIAPGLTRRFHPSHQAP